MRVNSWRQYQDGSRDSIWDIDEDYSNNKPCTSKWTGLNLQSELKQAFCHVLCLVMLGVKELLVHHREDLELWLLDLALIYAYFNEPSFMIVLCLWSCQDFSVHNSLFGHTVRSALRHPDSIFFFTFLIFTPKSIRSLAGDICGVTCVWYWGCWVMNLSSELSFFYR